MVLREDLLTACPSSCLEKVSFYSAEEYSVPLKKSQFLQVLEQVSKQRRLVRHTLDNTKKILTEVLAAMEDTEDFELKVSTLEGGVITVQVTTRTTIEELKTMLCEKKAEHPNERKILKAEVVVDGALVRHGDSHTLKAAELLDAEFEVVYSINEVEAATRTAICAKGPAQANIPASLVQISARAFQYCDEVVRVVIPESVTAIGESAFEKCRSAQKIVIFYQWVGMKRTRTGSINDPDRDLEEDFALTSMQNHLPHPCQDH